MSLYSILRGCSRMLLLLVGAYSSDFGLEGFQGLGFRLSGVGYCI